MGHTALILTPGVNTTETPALNSAGISSCQLIRFVYDPKTGAIPQKLGGWLRWYASAIEATVRSLWAWEDTAAVPHLAFGTTNISGTEGAQLGVITSGTLSDISPQYFTDNVTVSVNTTAGSPLVYINDSTVGTITQYDSVYITTQISVGGLILFGLYACNQDGLLAPGQYDVFATDTLGNLLPAPSTASGGVVPQFNTTSGAIAVTVTLPSHTYTAGATFPVLVSTTVGGITFYGNYIVESVTDANDFVILAGTAATSTTSGYLNGGNAQFIYSLGQGPVPSGTGYGIGGYGLGGYGTGSSVTPATGSSVPAVSWTMDNWGEVLVTVPINAGNPVLATTGASGTGSTATLTYSNSYIPPVGSTIVVAGVTPTGYNGTQTVTASSTDSVSFASTTTGAQTVAGTITVLTTPFTPIYAWDPLSGVPQAEALPNGPPVNGGIFVMMPQRQICAWGSTFTGVQDPLLVRWCDVNNYGVWIAQITNQAGSYRLTKGSKIIGGIQGPQQGLLWTDIDVWAMQYIGPPYIYSFNEIGTGCGLIGCKAVGSYNGIVYWMGWNQFFTLTADGVTPLLCPVWDVVFQQLDQTRLSEIRIAVNSRFNEVAWYYPIVGSSDVSNYVKYNAQLGVWDYGVLTRTAWVDQSVLGPPIGAGRDTETGVEYLYQHDGVNPSTGLPTTDDDIYAMTSYFQTGYAAMSEADFKMFVDQWWPDMKWDFYGQTGSGTVQLTIYFTDYPNQTPQSVGPYNLTSSVQFVSPRLRGRLVSFKIGSSDLGSFWRVGNQRYRGVPDGKF